MNLTKLSAVALSILLFGLSACENHQLAPSAQLPSGDVRSSEPAGFALDDIIVTVAKKHTLVKHGTAVLDYDAAGKLVKITDGNRTTSYTHSAGKIGVLTLVSGVKTEEGNYYLDANGRCTHSDVAGFSVEYGIPTKTLNWFKYEYDAKGRLTKRYHDIYPNMRLEFAYNADGDLTEVKEFDNPNNVIQKNTYEYQYAGSAILTDNNRLNAAEVVKLDPYLRIFGKTSKHLVQRLKIARPVYGGVNNDYRFTYSLNADGYPTVSKKYNVSNSVLLQTMPYEYVVTNLTVTP